MGLKTVQCTPLVMLTLFLLIIVSNCSLIWAFLFKWFVLPFVNCLLFIHLATVSSISRLFLAQVPNALLFAPGLSLWLVIIDLHAFTLSAWILTLAINADTDSGDPLINLCGYIHTSHVSLLCNTKLLCHMLFLIICQNAQTTSFFSKCILCQL